MRPVLPVIAFDAAGLGERPDRAVAAGRARRLARGVYTTDLTSSAEEIVTRHVWELIAHFVPDAVICDRSAGPSVITDGTIFVSSVTRRRDVVLPGLRIVVRPGTGPLPDDMPWMSGLHRSSIARALVENLAPSRTAFSGRRTLTADELAEWVALLAQQHTPERLGRIRDRARELSSVLGHAERWPVLDRMFATVSGSARDPRPGLGAEMAAGRGWDVARLAAFAKLAESLQSGRYDDMLAPLPVLKPEVVREQPFFEAYLSNYIEGTEFSLDEAIGIVYDARIPASRPQDAHDITATYELIVDADERRIPRNGDELLDQLAAQHAHLMAGRPQLRPGQFKDAPNRVGSYRFVEPALVRGTLTRGLAFRDHLDAPFARAIYMMFLVSEVHPFDDGNGRLARLAMNAELSAAGEHRVLVPIISRNDYLNGLRRQSRDGDPGLLVRVLARTRQWSAQVDFSTLVAARAWMRATNALIDSTDAEREGLHLELPIELDVSS